MKHKHIVKLLAPALCLGFLGAAQHQAQAHYLWAEINHNQVHLALTEVPGEAGVALDKVENSIVKAGDQSLTLNRDAEKSYLWATLPANASVAAASNNWGVLDRTKQGRGIYLLYYHAKAARTLADAAQAVSLPAQWYAKYQDGKILARFIKNGHPLASAPVKITLPDGQTKELLTDNSGKVLFDIVGNGVYGLRGAWNTDVKGSYQGKTYPSVHHYSTLTFHVDRAASAHTPAQ